MHSGKALVLAWAAAFAVAGSHCKPRTFSDNVAPAERSQLAFGSTPDLGVARSEFRSPGGVREFCLRPKHFPGFKYGAGDTDEETRLCAIDFHSKSTVACPSASGAFPWASIESIGPKLKASFELTSCKETKRAGKPLARFQPSASCAFSGAALGYYHLSRILGLGSVPVAVVRTLDAREWNMLAERGAALSAPGELGHQLWRGFSVVDGNLALRRNLYTPDGASVFGALSEPFGDPLSASSARATAPEYGLNFADATLAREAFFASAAVSRSLKPEPVGAFLGASFASFAPALLQMKDAFDVVLIDFLMQQQNRFGNVQTNQEWVWQDATGALHTQRALGADRERAPAAGAVLARRIQLRENACALRPGNPKAFTESDLRRMRHASPETYARLRAFAAVVKEQGAEFFNSQALFAASEALGLEAGADGLASRAIRAADLLEERCRTGELLLDVSLSAHAQKRNSPSELIGLCDAVFPLEPVLAEASREAPGGPESSVAGQRAPASNNAPAGNPAPVFPRQCAVAARGSNMRKTPSPEAPVVMKLSRKRMVDVEGLQGGWFAVRVGGKKGYVNALTLAEPCLSIAAPQPSP